MITNTLTGHDKPGKFSIYRRQQLSRIMHQMVEENELLYTLPSRQWINRLLDLCPEDKLTGECWLDVVANTICYLLHNCPYRHHFGPVIHRFLLAAEEEIKELQ